MAGVNYDQNICAIYQSDGSTLKWIGSVHQPIEYMYFPDQYGFEYSKDGK